MAKVGAHTVHHWCATQQLIATSSGESELYALTRCAAQVLGLISAAWDLGVRREGKVHCDSSAAIGIVHRRGLGKLRHIDVQYLWLQQRIRNKSLQVAKVRGTDNPADLMTKFVSRESILKHLEGMSFEVTEGRHAAAPKL